MAYLPEEDVAMLAIMQRVAVLLPHWVILLQREVHQLPVHIVTLGQDQIIAELQTGGNVELKLNQCLRFNPDRELIYLICM